MGLPLSAQVEERGGTSAEVVMLPLKEKTKITVPSRPRTHCLESDGRRQLMTLGQAFFLCEDEVGGPGGERGKVEPVGSPGLVRVCPGSAEQHLGTRRL